MRPAGPPHRNEKWLWARETHPDDHWFVRLSYPGSKLGCVNIEVEAGVSLHVRHREGSGRPFLLVHGLSSNARLWDEVAAALSDAGHPAWAVDLRSHGESTPTATGHDTASAAADLAVVIGRLGLERPIVVGQSWGGNVVVRLAAKHPELVSAVGLVDGGWGDLSAGFRTWEECERKLRPPNMDGMTAAALRRWLADHHSDWSETAVAATLANFRIRPDGTLERRLPVEHHMRILRSMWDDPPAPYLPLITVPVLLLPAAGPDEPKAERVMAAAALMRAATIAWYPHGDHDLHAQHPARLAADLLKLASRDRA